MAITKPNQGGLISFMIGTVAQVLLYKVQRLIVERFIELSLSQLYRETLASHLER